VTINPRSFQRDIKVTTLDLPGIDPDSADLDLRFRQGVEEAGIPA
jgi:hypothetical protein